MRLGQASTPDGMRIYAIGDIHGCLGQLTDLHTAITDDLAASPVDDHRIIHLGDYVDRGPDSAGVIERLSTLSKNNPRIATIRGNHDQIMLEFLDGELERMGAFLAFGGRQTLRSYGCVVGSDPDRRQLAQTAGSKIPGRHIDFLRSLPLVARFGDYFFCHAGVRPGVALARQDQQDLIWIRDEFLTSTADHGAIIVHGHTPADAPEVRPNRINVDTGAVFGGRLTCVVLEGTGHRFLEA